MYKIPAHTVFTGKRIVSLPQCESTNSLMISMAQTALLEEGTLIITENQTDGRGQAGNRWTVEPLANLTFSILLKPNFIEPSEQFYLNMAIGLGISDCVLEILTRSGQSISNPLVSPQVKLKWPNDILIHDKKVCGILIESQIQGQKLTQSVVGIGLNVNQKNFEWPLVSSLSLVASMDFNKTEVLETLLIKIDARYSQLISRNFQKLKEDYYSFLYRKGETHEFQSDGKIFMGIIEGVDEVGRLLVLVEGAVRRYNFKAITFVR